jgi:hypothetical protein
VLLAETGRAGTQFLLAGAFVVGGHVVGLHGRSPNGRDL